MNAHHLSLVIVFCGVLIWSCNQIGVETDEYVYQYSTKETEILKSLAKQYGFPENKLIFIDKNKLPSLDDWETYFILYCGYDNTNLDIPNDTIYISNGRFHVQTTTHPFKRNLSASMEYTGSHSECIRDYSKGNDFVYLNFDVSWEKAYPTQPIPEANNSIHIDFSAEPCYELINKGYYTTGLSTTWKWEGSTTICISYKYTLCCRTYSLFESINREGKFDVNVAFKN